MECAVVWLRGASWVCRYGCALPVFWKGNSYRSCTCSRISVSVPSSVCLHPLWEFDDVLVVPSRLFWPVQHVILNGCSNFVHQSENRRYRSKHTRHVWRQHWLGAQCYVQAETQSLSMTRSRWRTVTTLVLTAAVRFARDHTILHGLGMALGF